jgi:hypothetical protein
MYGSNISPYTRAAQPPSVYGDVRFRAPNPLDLLDFVDNELVQVFLLGQFNYREHIGASPAGIGHLHAVQSRHTPGHVPRLSGPDGNHYVRSHGTLLSLELRAPR